MSQERDTSVQAARSREIERLAPLKFGLLAEGARISPEADAALYDAKRPIRTRSGVSGGLDLHLGAGVDVNVPVRERFALESRYLIDFDSEHFFVRRDEAPVANVRPHPTPAYYGEHTSDGAEPMHKIGQMCSADRFCYGMTGPTCYFWAKSRRCQYCSIGRNYSEDARRKHERNFIEVLRAAVHDPKLPARHVLIGGGTPPGDDMGASLASQLCRAVKEEFPALSIYVMIAAPLRNDYIDELIDAGADEIGFNLEFWTEASWRRYIPGKHAVIGRDRYLEALSYTVERLGPIKTRSILIAGLEPLDATRAACIELAARGVMPVVSPFRPLEDAALSHERGPSGDEYVELWSDLDGALKPLGIPVGPACAACQNNTLALPTDGRYHTFDEDLRLRQLGGESGLCNP